MSMETLSREQVCSIVVTYFPEDETIPRLDALSKLGAQLVIVDNTPDNKAETVLQHAERKGVFVIRNRCNRGLGTALNQGMAEAQRRGFQWALLADQDSEISPDILHCCKALLNDRSRGAVAVIGNNYANVVGDTPIPLMPVPVNGPSYRTAKAVITAGSLVSVSYHARLGGFRDDFFIDWLDTEYCYRARRLGGEVWMILKTLVYQRIGDTRGLSIGWRSVYASNHAPIRRYYMARNLILILKDYFFFEPAWCAGRMIDLIKTAIKILAFEKNKAAKLRALTLGFCDGISGRSRYAMD